MAKLSLATACASFVLFNLSVATGQPLAPDDQRMLRSPSVGSGLMIRDIGGQCNPVLQGNIYDKNQYLSYDYHAKRFWRWACESNFSTSQQMEGSAAELGIPLKSLPLNINFSDNSYSFQQSLRNWCQSSSSQIYDEAFRSRFSQTISSAMTDAYSRCVTATKEVLLNQYGVFAQAEPENQALDSFVVTLWFRDLKPGAHKIHNVAGSADCYVGDTKLPSTYDVNANTIALTCKKPSAAGVLLSFNTDLGRTPAVDLPSSQDSIIERLRNDLNFAKYRISSLENKTPNYVTIEETIASGGGVVTKTIACPPGAKAMGGGAKIAAEPVSPYLRESYPSDDRNSWTVSVGNFAGDHRPAGRVRLFAVCYPS